MCDPILVTLAKMRPQCSHSSRENATPSSGTSPLASSYKEVPPPHPPELEVHAQISSQNQQQNDRSLSVLHWS